MDDRSGDDPGLSLDELKSNLFSTLQKEGAIDQIRVHLRTTFVQKLQKRSATMHASTLECTLLEKVANTLLCEYLRAKQLKHTLSVFLPEVGPRNCELEPDMVAKMLRLPSTPASPAGLLEMLSQVERSASISTHEMQTQTHDEDRRYILESELQRIDAMYVAQSHAQREQPAKSFEDRILQYQQEYDRMAQAHLAHEITRIRDTEIAAMRVDERKAYLHEMEKLRSTLQAEYTAKQAALDEAERSLHIAYLEKQRQAELDLFELRQTLLKEMDAVQTKDRELTSLIDAESRKWQTESRRLVVLQDNVAAREAQMVATIARLEEDKATYTAHCEREAAARVARQQADLDALAARLSDETACLRRAQNELTAFHSKMAALEVDVLTLRGIEADLKLQLEHATLELTHQKRHSAALQSQLQQTSTECESVRAQCSCHAETIARLEREAKAVASVADAHRKELDDRVQALQTELHTTRASHVALRMESAEALIAAKEQLLAAHHADQESWLSREQRLRSQLHELSAKCAESDAAVGRYRTQLEDEQVHVASLRHEVESLSALVTSLKCAVPSREYAPRSSYYEPRGTHWTHPPWQEARAPASAPPPPPIRVPAETRTEDRELAKNEAPPPLHHADDDAWRKHEEDLAREAERDLQVRELEARLEAAAHDAEVARLAAQRQRDEERAADARKALEDQRAQQKAIEAALQQREADREREAREAEATRDRERAAQDALREQLAAEKDRVLAAKRELEAAREAQAREAEQLAKTRQEQEAAADRAAQEAREHKAQLARATEEALEQEAAREAHARELRQAQETQDALERQAREAEVRQADEARKALEREAQEATEREARESREESERQAREAQATTERLALEAQEAAEREAREDEEARAESERQAREAQVAADRAAARQAAADDARRAEADRQAMAEEEERARLVHEAQIERARQAQEELDALATQRTLGEGAEREAEARDAAAREAQAQADEAARLAQAAAAAQQQDQSIIEKYRLQTLARRERQRQEEEAKLQAEREAAARVAAAALEEEEEEEAGFESDDALSVGGGDDDAAAR